jgi:AMP nucleosidase
MGKTTNPDRALSPDAAVRRLEQIYEGATTALTDGLAHYFKTGKVPSEKTRAQFRYPMLRVHWPVNSPQPPSSRRAYAKLQHPGTYETTITQPAAFRSYLLEQLTPLVSEYGVTLEAGVSAQEIPYPYVFESVDEIARGTATARDLARHFPTPQLAVVGDEIADGLYEPPPGAARPLSLFDAVRVDYSLRRLVHYTGTDWRHVQRWILLTNYHRYVDQFVRFGRARLKAGGPFTRLVLPGNLTITAKHSDAEAEALMARSPWSRSQMPAYHLAGPEGDGVTLVNIGIGPSNAKNITDHLAVLRPNCWLMVGHCGGLRESQRIGDYVLAHGYLRQDRILDSLLPPEIPIPALAEIQVALQEAAANVTGLRGEALKECLRTGTVVTNDDRNWELRYTQEKQRINLSRAIAVDMESGTVAAQGYRLRVPYGALLCVSDKPLHGEIKLPGAANAFYERAVAQHLEIGLTALEILKTRRESLHSRKLRSFDEPPFR